MVLGGMVSYSVRSFLEDLSKVFVHTLLVEYVKIDSSSQDTGIR